MSALADSLKRRFYEGEKSNVHLTMWTLDELACMLIAHYPATDLETK